MNREYINNLVEQGKGQGLNIRVRDIAFVCLSSTFEDEELAYATIFGQSDKKVIDEYIKSEVVEFVREELNDTYSSKTSMVGAREDISFEENKAYMLKLKSDTERAMELGEIDKKDGLKILTDISTKLNDKFQISAEERNQIVVVNQKYDEEVCPYCHREISRKPITKQEAIKMYNLVEKI